MNSIATPFVKVALSIFLPFFAVTLTCPFALGSENATARAHVPFIANGGETDEDVAFYARTFGGTVFVTKEGEIVYALPKSRTEGWSIGENLINGTPEAIRGADEAITKVSRFKGSDPDLWWTNIPTFGSVDFGEVYEGIRLELVARGRNAEKVFHVGPNARPEDIRIKVSGAESLTITDAGTLRVETGLGAVEFTKPLAWQEEEAGRKFVEAAYRVDGDEYRFEIGNYDRETTLVIDPLLASTFLGGNDLDRGGFLVLDGGDYVYSAGYTMSHDFPASPGAYAPIFCGGTYDAFIAKFDGDLSTLIACTYLGGSEGEGWYYIGIALDSNGDLCVTGNTESSDFPTTAGAYDATYNGGSGGPYGVGGDIFVSKLDPQLQNLIASTYVGGSGHDYCRLLAFDSSGLIQLGGWTSSSDFPTTAGAYDETYNPGGYFGDDQVLFKLSADLTTLAASTFLGGTKDDFNEGMALDAQGNVFVAGWTSSLNYPTTPGAFDTTYNGYSYDAFVSKLSGDLAQLLASTYIGGSSWEFVYGLAMDDAGCVYLTGHTASKNFPTTPGAYIEDYVGTGGANYGDDVFITRMDNDLTSVLASTYLGGTKWENASGIALDGKGHVYVAGATSSPDFPIRPGAYCESYNGGTKHCGDIFVTRLDDDLTELSASTYFGGVKEDGGLFVSVYVGGDKSIYVTGPTNCTDFPTTPGAYEPTYKGGDGDVFVTKLDGLLSSDLVVSEASGGTLLLDVDAGVSNAGRDYILLGTVSGTSPGTPLPGGSAVLPLNFDAFMLLVILNLNTPFFQDFTGTLDDWGTAIAALSLGPVPGGAGATMHFAFALNKPWDFVSDPVAVPVVP